MTSIIKLQPMSGVFDEGPLCYLLQVDEFRFLLDCGWDETCNMVHLKELKKHIHQIDAVLLTYPDQLHIGALPYVVGHLGLSCPIFATIPTYKMGQMFMYDYYQSRHNTEDFDLFSLDDVDCAFDKIVQLKYSQIYPMKGKGHGLTIVPLAAGHMIGGTIWKITKDGEEDIVYAVDYNHKKERHLNGCGLESIDRPSLLITDAFNATYQQSRRRLRDEQLLTNILQTMRNDGNCLVVVDTAGRVLELAHLLDQLWHNEDSGLIAYSLAFVNNVSYNVVEFAKSLVEWMSDKIMRSFEDKRNNPFQFRHVQLCHSLAELAKVPEPKVVLASVPDLECGFSRDLFLQWCSNPKNSIILTSRTSPGTCTRQLIDNPSTKMLNLEVRKRVKLEGVELEEYMHNEKEQQDIEARRKAEALLKEEESSSGEESGDDDMDMDVVTVTQDTKVSKHDLLVKGEGKSRGGGFFKHAKKSYPMFPAYECKIKWDDYGEIIKPEDYMIADKGPDMEEKLTKENGDVVIEEEEQDISNVPTKSVRSIQRFPLNACVTYIDFEGRSDGESYRKIISQIRPRQLVLVHGTEEATLALADYCRITPGIVQEKVFTPRMHEIIDATTESHIYQVKLKDILVSHLEFCKTKETEVAWVEGQINMANKVTDTSAMEEEEMEDSKLNTDSKHTSDEKMEADEEIVPILDSVPILQMPGHTAVFINDLKLSDFKQTLLQAGYQAEFSGGVLVINNTVAVRRTEIGKFSFEGCLSEEYYTIRELFYDQFAIM
ncbi:PREDICTED: cleavage and polyadenylation specificity factor subunit 2-like [Priapulus caudatus]|uniref:Cleavage and polyadenylation specificity factor subunit 2 n=1 Tax=Priapulus caudatus TaxID=37621 RepID=A0ABM1DV14_PRICU|nr:PREDICTED: cleavage and polyadenylation specificity factor subunit 2-like [Priapulus caudatus]XP_014663786.1 PREDICTED: cleavage and polyadenylation specificity factor subunit 2-like [Priapulus caudatus]